MMLKRDNEGAWEYLSVLYQDAAEDGSGREGFLARVRSVSWEHLYGVRSDEIYAGASIEADGGFRTRMDRLIRETDQAAACFEAAWRSLQWVPYGRRSLK